MRLVIREVGATLKGVQLLGQGLASCKIVVEQVCVLMSK